MPNRVVSIIDDDPSVRDGVIDLLLSAGFAAESFNSAEGFLKSGRVDNTSCVVADMRMPGTSGLELHHALLQAGKEIPTILITAFPKEVDRIRALDSGVYRYLSKPFEENELLSSIRLAVLDPTRTLSRSSNGPIQGETAVLIKGAQSHRGVKLRIEQLDSPAALEKIIPEWESLDAQISPHTPFTSPLWATLWWRHLRQMRRSIWQEFFVHTVRDENDKLIAIVPLVITHKPGSGPLRLRLLQFFGAADGSITEHRCIICKEDDESRIIHALASYLYDRKDRWDLFVWTGIRRDRAGHDRLGSLLKVYRETPYYLVPLPESWERYRGGLSANTKEAIRKCYKHLARNGLNFTFRAVADPGHIPASLDRLLTLHSERAEFKYAIRHRDLFAKAQHRAFIAEVASLMAKRDQVRIFELEVGGQIVASRMAFLLEDELYLYYSGYDLAWRKHSVMTTLMCECFKWAIERGVKVVNLSKGKDRSKMRWRGREVAFYDALVMPPTRRGRLISRAYDLLKGHPDVFAKLTEFLTIAAGIVGVIWPGSNGLS